MCAMRSPVGICRLGLAETAGPEYEEGKVMNKKAIGLLLASGLARMRIGE